MRNCWVFKRRPFFHVVTDFSYLFSCASATDIAVYVVQIGMGEYTYNMQSGLFYLGMQNADSFVYS